MNRNRVTPDEEIMMKTEVIIEDVVSNPHDVVSVIPYDKDNRMEVGESIEVCPREEAYKRYTVIGDIRDGNICLYDDDNEIEEDYSEFSDIEED